MYSSTRTAMAYVTLLAGSAAILMASGTAASPDSSSTTSPCVNDSLNGTVYTAANSERFTVECSTDLPGGDLQSVEADNFSACIESCSTTSGCVGASYLGDECYMKSSISPASSSSSVSSAVLVGNTTATGPTCVDDQSNGTTYTASNNGVYTIYCATDFYGGDLSNLQTSSFADCINTCDNTTSCTDVSYVSGACYLKSSQTTGSSNANVWSANKPPSSGSSQSGSSSGSTASSSSSISKAGTSTVSPSAMSTSVGSSSTAMSTSVGSSSTAMRTSVGSSSTAISTSVGSSSSTSSSAKSSTVTVTATSTRASSTSVTPATSSSASVTPVTSSSVSGAKTSSSLVSVTTVSSSPVSVVTVTSIRSSSPVSTYSSAESTYSLPKPWSTSSSSGSSEVSSTSSMSVSAETSSSKSSPVAFFTITAIEPPPVVETIIASIESYQSDLIHFGATSEVSSPSVSCTTLSTSVVPKPSSSTRSAVELMPRDDATTVSSAIEMENARPQYFIMFILKQHAWGDRKFIVMDGEEKIKLECNRHKASPFRYDENDHLVEYRSGFRRVAGLLGNASVADTGAYSQMMFHDVTVVDDIRQATCATTNGIVNWKFDGVEYNAGVCRKDKHEKLWFGPKSVGGNSNGWPKHCHQTDVYVMNVF